MCPPRFLPLAMAMRATSPATSRPLSPPCTSCSWFTNTSILDTNCSTHQLEYDGKNISCHWAVQCSSFQGPKPFMARMVVFAPALKIDLLMSPLEKNEHCNRPGSETMMALLKKNVLVQCALTNHALITAQ